MERTVPTLLDSLSRRGLSISLTEDGNLKLTGPKENRTDAHREFIVANRDAIIAILTDEKRETEAGIECGVALVRDAMEAAFEERMPVGEKVRFCAGATTTEPAKVILMHWREYQSIKATNPKHAAILAQEIYRIAQWWDNWQIERFLEEA